MTPISHKIFRGLLVAILVCSMLFVTACDGNKDKKPTVSSGTTSSSESGQSNTSSNTSSNASSSSSDTSVGNKVNTVGGELSADITTEIPEGVAEPEVPFPRDRDIVNTKTGTPKKGESDAIAAKRRQEILNTENGNFKPTGDGKIYYISSINGSNKNDGLSPEKPLRSASTLVPEPGSVVLFERGSVFRLNAALNLRDNVIYSSYGEGEKPAFYGSPYNYAKKVKWQPSRKKNVWYTDFGDTDCSAVIFNHGEDIGVKKQGGINQLTENGNFFHNGVTATLYLYCDKGNPGDVYEDIEIAISTMLLKVAAGGKNITIDNLALKYANFGIRTQKQCENITITNCEIGYIGGANIGVAGNRYGNGIELWDGAINTVVDNCWIYQCFDTAVTWQGSLGCDYDCTFTNNLLEYNCISIEMWDRGEVKDLNDQSVVRFICNDNISRFSGFGWGNRNYDSSIRGIEGHISGGFHRTKTVYAEYKNNIFDQAWNRSMNISGIWDEDDADPQATRTVIFEGNSYYEGSNHNSSKSHSLYPLFEKDTEGKFIVKDFLFTSQASLEEMVALFEKNPKVVKFLG